MIGDPLIELDEASGSATTDTYAVVYQLGDQKQNTGDLTLGIRYLDELVRIDDAWVIRRRLSKTLWMR